MTIASVLVISYIRFSTPRQALGDSLRRQFDATRAWCDRHGYTLNESLSFRDLGVSAFSGANVSAGGALAAIIKLAESGKFPPGSILVLEALDRLTRQALPIAIPLLLRILELGLEVVTLHDEKHWTQARIANPTDFVMAVLLLGQGHGESERKSGRVRDSFAAQRDAGISQGFGSAPGWLKRTDKRSPWEPIPELVDSVVKAFEMCAVGFGSPAIAKKANAEGWPLPVRKTKQTGETWHSRLPGRLLRDTAVLGHHEHRIRNYEEQAKHWTGKSTGDVIEDYYPRILSEELWYRAQAAIETRTKPRRRDDHFYNIWSGLICCGRCGATLQRKVEHRGYSRGQLLCSNSMSGATDCPPASVRLTDPTLLREITLYSASMLGIQEEAGKEISTRLEAAQFKLKTVEAASERVAAVIVDVGESLPALTRQAVDLGKQRTELLSSIELLKSEIASFEPDLFDDAYAMSVLAVLFDKTEEAKAIRADCNQRLHRAVKKIWLWPYDMALVEYREIPGFHGIGLPHRKPGKTEHPYFDAWTAGKLFPPLVIQSSS